MLRRCRVAEKVIKKPWTLRSAMKDLSFWNYIAHLLGKQRQEEDSRLVMCDGDGDGGDMMKTYDDDADDDK
eukprot:4945714-Karenia_brevis.AAC.1